jgi:hypothetical protein
MQEYTLVTTINIMLVFRLFSKWKSGLYSYTVCLCVYITLHLLASKKFAYSYKTHYFISSDHYINFFSFLPSENSNMVAI